MYIILKGGGGGVEIKGLFARGGGGGGAYLWVILTVNDVNVLLICKEIFIFIENYTCELYIANYIHISEKINKKELMHQCIQVL